VIAAGCVANNYIDRDIDKRMARTKNRALVTGEISGQNALIFATILGVIGFTVLAFKVNWLTVGVGLTGLVDYVVLYGYFKRRSIHGTLVGSIAGSTPIIAGYCAASGRLDAPAILLFLIMAVWQMPHFFAIATYRFKDYKKAGLPVWTVKKGIPNAKIHIASYISLYAALNVYFGLKGYTSTSYLVVMLGVSLWWFYRAIKGFSTSDDTKWGRQIFGSSLLVLLAFSLMLSVDHFLP
jgi:protoheme IX farnesyltransferase